MGGVKLMQLQIINHLEHYQKTKKPEKKQDDICDKSNQKIKNILKEQVNSKPASLDFFIVKTGQQKPKLDGHTWEIMSVSFSHNTIYPSFQWQNNHYIKKIRFNEIVQAFPKRPILSFTATVSIINPFLQSNVKSYIFKYCNKHQFFNL
ncbi:unnamed protein product [Paramecium pentaurelia]|uniref:Uncharacterized protein n=1 Tax=Paramecium pentaurelia TaxID=43138 RepID=A0A8S1Y0D0_9CILI|nr:unnamed protein product [Paramecium pentaurelia]